MYDVLVCGACVLKIDTLRRYAGTPGILMVVRDTSLGTWKVIGLPEDQDERVDIGTDSKPANVASTGEKRPLSPSVEEAQLAKRQRALSPSKDPVTTPESSSLSHLCLAPEPNPKAQDVLSAMKSEASRGAAGSVGAGDIFLTHGWRDRWCRCSTASRLSLFRTSNSRLCSLPSAPLRWKLEPS